MFGYKKKKKKKYSGKKARLMTIVNLFNFYDVESDFVNNFLPLSIFIYLDPRKFCNSEGYENKD